jgi:uncharacterized protein YjbI with pentapeptide repeats
MMLGGYATWTLNLYQVDRFGLDSANRWEIWARVGGALIVMLGFALTAWRIKVSNRQVSAIEDGQVTERFMRAIEQLGSERSNGSPNLEIRLGGIYALERLARDSERDHWTVMEVLATYARENLRDLSQSFHSVGDDGADSFDLEAQLPRVDIQAALTVIGRRERRREPGRLDLADAWLAAAKLASLDFSGACLSRANLTKADLKGARLEGIRLDGAFMERAIFVGARLQGADMRGSKLREADLEAAVLDRVNLEKADLSQANLKGASLLGAKLRGANLMGTNLKEALLSLPEWRVAHRFPEDLFESNIDLQSQYAKRVLSEAEIDRQTVLPAYLEHAKDELLAAQAERDKEPPS